MATTKKTNNADITRPATFDIEGWRAGKVTPTRTVQVTNNPEAAAELGRLAAQKTQLELVMSQTEGTTQSKRRLAATDKGKDEIRRIDRELADLHATLEGTWLDVNCRGLTPNEVQSIREAKPKPGIPTSSMMMEIGCGLRHAGTDTEHAPLTADGWASLIEAIGQDQYLKVDAAVNDLTFAEVVGPDFYTSFSASPDTKTSSGN